MRLIDVDALKEKEQYIPCGNGMLFHGVTAATIDAMPTIDPETLPVVQELQSELKRVTSERDAALADLKYIASCECCAYGCKNLEVDHCFDCGEKECRCRNCLGGDCWAWRGLVAENATAESEPKPRWKELAALQPIDGVGLEEGPERSSRNG